MDCRQKSQLSFFLVYFLHRSRSCRRLKETQTSWRSLTPLCTSWSKCHGKLISVAVCVVYSVKEKCVICLTVKGITLFRLLYIYKDWFAFCGDFPTNSPVLYVFLKKVFLFVFIFQGQCTLIDNLHLRVSFCLKQSLEWLLDYQLNSRLID